MPQGSSVNNTNKISILVEVIQVKQRVSKQTVIKCGKCCAGGHIGCWGASNPDIGGVKEGFLEKEIAEQKT